MTSRPRALGCILILWIYHGYVAKMMVSTSASNFWFLLKGSGLYAPLQRVEKSSGTSCMDSKVSSHLLEALPGLGPLARSPVTCGFPGFAEPQCLKVHGQLYFYPYSDNEYSESNSKSLCRHL